MLPLSGCAGVSATDAADFAVAAGYTAAVYEGKTDKGAAFLACGTGGRLDRIYGDGSVENIPLPVGEKHLTSLLHDEKTTLAAGLSGALVFRQTGGAFQQAEGAGREHILGLAAFNGGYYAATFSGKILFSANGSAWRQAAKPSDKPLTAIAADETRLIAVTTDSDIYKSVDGAAWTSQNYNDTYKGLAVPQTFHKIINLEETFMILGNPLETPGVPSLMLSYDGGETFSFSALREINARPPEEFYPITVNAVQYYAGELLAACDKGRVLTFTDCPTCNLIMDADAFADLRAMAIFEDMLLLAGDGFHFELMDAGKLRQNNIAPEQALIEIDYGATVIDVRTAEEYAAEHIPGSLHIPADEIAARLAQTVPDQTGVILFYCVSGKKSQAALETALQLGYQNAFNLGGLSDWPYETEKSDGE
jgi:rhodanese-related sulfurtransferase